MVSALAYIDIQANANQNSEARAGWKFFLYCWLGFIATSFDLNVLFG